MWKLGLNKKLGCFQMLSHSLSEVGGITAALRHHLLLEALADYLLDSTGTPSQH